MATNNSINLTSSGIVKYDGAGTFSALANPLVVSEGGLGVSSNTAFAVLCGGTTSTNPIQSIASVGTSGQVFTSNGAGTLPTFQTSSGSSPLAFIIMTDSATTVSDGSTRFLSTGSLFTAFNSSSNRTRYYAATSGTITACYGAAIVEGVLASSGDSTLYIRKNDTTDTVVTSTLAMTAASNPFSNTGLSISLSAGDYIEFKIVLATWATNPTVVSLSATALIT